MESISPCAAEALQSMRGPVSPGTEDCPQSHYGHGITVDKRDRGSCVTTGRSISHQWALGPPPSLNLNLQASLHPVTEAGPGLCTQLQLGLRPHTCVSLTPAFPNNSAVLLGIGKLLKTGREKCQVPQGVAEWAGSWPR